MPNATVPNVVCYSLRSCQPQRLITCACMHTTRRQASLLALYTHDSSWHAAQCAYVGQGWAWLPKRKPPAGPVAPPVSCQHTIALPPRPRQHSWHPQGPHPQTSPGHAAGPNPATKNAAHFPGFWPRKRALGPPSGSIWRPAFGPEFTASA